MNFSQFIPLTAAIVNFGLTLFVLSRGLRANVNRVYLLWGLSVTLWNAGTFMMFTAHNPQEAVIWARILQFGVIFLPISLAHLCLLIANISWGKVMKYLYLVHILLALSNFTPFFLSGVRDAGFAYYSIAGPGFWMFTATYTVPIFAVFAFYSHMGQMPPMRRKRLNALIITVALLIIFGINDTLPILGVYYYPHTHIAIFPLGSMVAIFYGIIVSYSVLQHQLLDVHVILGRVAAHVLRLGFVFIIGLTSLLAISTVMPRSFTVVSFATALIVLLISMLAASFLFPRLFGSGTEILEKRLLGDRFEYHDQIRSFIGSMQWYNDTNQLLSDLDSLLVNTIRMDSYKIILLDENNRGFSLFRAHPEESRKEYPEIHINSPIFRFFQASKSEYLTFNIDYATPGNPALEQDTREQLRQFNSEFCFPFFFEDEPFGLLLIGKKASADPYTSTDLNLLVSLSKNLGVMINQIRLKSHILQAQELELLGRMSRGMAHDLNNLLTPVWTFLQLSNEGAPVKDLNEDLLPVALRNLKAMRSYIREALFFSENLRPDFQLGRLDVVVSQSVDIVRAKTEKSVDILVSSPGEVLVEMDEVLIQRLIANIVSNAVDASRPGSTIHIELVRLVKTEMNRDWLRVRVADSGEGIRPEDLNRVFTPYFTTKNRGDAERGFGLGLAICRKIVHLHGGNLNIASQVKKGTTVQIDLPNRQVKPPISVPTH